MIKLSIVQFAPRFGDVHFNLSTIKRMISGVDSQLFVLPELANSGYRFKNYEEAYKLSESIDSSLFINSLVDIAKSKNAYIVSGFCERDGDKLYNSSVLIGEEGVIGVYRKLHLFWDEKNIFTQGDKGLPVFDTNIGRFGMLVCFDWMFPEAWRSLALQGARIIAHPSNLVLPYCQSVVPSYALINRCFIATANRIGKEQDLTFTGQSVLCSPKGHQLLFGSKDKEQILTTEIDLADADDKFITPLNDVFQDRRDDVYGNLNILND